MTSQQKARAQQAQKQAQSTTSSLRSLDDDVLTVLELQERIEDLQAQLVAAKARIADRGVGRHETSTGVVATVYGPAHRFDKDKAWTLLTEDQRAVCMSPDTTKIRQQLPPVLAEQCMTPGTGRLQVRIS